MTAESSEPSFPRRVRRRNAPRHVKMPASVYRPSDQNPPTREEWDALMRKVKEQTERFERFERERIRRAERERQEQGRADTA